MKPPVEPPTGTLPEPWMRGIEPGVDPVIGHLLRAAQHIREDLAAAIAPLSVEQLWAKPHGMTSAGFHAQHIAGSTERLCEYLEGRQLTTEQLARLRREGSGEEPAGALLAGVEHALVRYEGLIRALPPAEFGTVREIGRKRLQTTAISLAIHIAEHGMRHVGQAVSAAKLSLAVSSAKL
ncbi:MAG: DinB family protein [Acidobacteriota bacterium]|nr:DinB family protein [Acidobacteriota bacterium]